MDREKKYRGLGLQMMVAALGCVAFCIYSQCWRDWARCIYDVPASFAVFCYVARLVRERVNGTVDGFWLARFLMLAAMTVVTVGREFSNWHISGHLSCVLAVALSQVTNRRLAGWEQLLYWIPIPIVTSIRWFLFDENGHWESINAILFALVAAAPVAVIGRIQTATTTSILRSKQS